MKRVLKLRQMPNILCLLAVFSLVSQFEMKANATACSIEKLDAKSYIFHNGAQTIKALVHL